MGSIIMHGTVTDLSTTTPESSILHPTTVHQPRSVLWIHFLHLAGPSSRGWRKCIDVSIATGMDPAASDSLVDGSCMPCAAKGPDKPKAF